MARRTRLAVAGLGGVAAGAVAARRRWTRALDPTGGRPLDLPAGTATTVIAADGARLAVWSMGPDSQPPIVAVHGWTGDRRVWSAVARHLLADGRRVVVYDQRGHGGSTVGAAGTTLDALGDDLAAVLEALDAHDAVVAGHSMGGMAVQALAVRHKDVVAARVAGLALVSTAAERVVLGSAHLAAGARLATSPRVAAAMASRLAGPWLVRSSFGRAPALAALDATRRSWLATPPEVRLGFLEAMADLDFSADLASVTVPTVVVSGDRDTLTLPARSRDLARAIPGARLEVLAGIGHQTVFEAPARLADILTTLTGPVRTSPAGG